MLPLVLPDVVDRADVGVVEGRGGAGFALEPFDRVRVAGRLRGQELERDAAAQAPVFGLVDDTHPFRRPASRAPDSARPSFRINAFTPLPQSIPGIADGLPIERIGTLDWSSGALMPVILALDQGTTSSRAILFGQDGEIKRRRAA